MNNIVLVFCLFIGFVSWGQRVILDELTVFNNTYSLNGNLYNGSVYNLYDSGQLKEEFELKDGVLHGRNTKYYLDNNFKKKNFKDTLEIKSLLNDIDTINNFISKIKEDSIREKQISHNIKFVELGVKKFHKYKEKYTKGKLKEDKLSTYKRYLRSIKKFENSVQKLIDYYPLLDSLKLDLKEENNKSIYKDKLKDSYTYIMGNQTGIHRRYNEDESLSLEEELKDGVRNGSYKTFDNSKIKEEGTYINNKKNGVWTIYKNNHPHEYINFKDDLKSGLYKKYNKWGDNLVIIGIYQNNLKEGTWTKNDQNGKLMILSNYKNDTLNGLFQRFESDTVTKEGFYQYGLKVGGWKEFSNSGELLSTSFYSRDTLNGLYKKYYGDVIVQEGSYSNGLMNGEWVFRDDNGNIKAKGNYIDGDGGNKGASGVPKNGRDGKWSFYYENGNIKNDFSYINGSREGKCIWYYENGNKSFICNSKNNLNHGDAIWYYETGEIKQKTNIKEGKEDGKYVIYFKNGKVKSQQYYKNGTNNFEGNTYKEYNESGDLISQQVCKENYLISGFYWEKVLSDKELYEEARKAINETNQMLNCKPCYGKITSVGGSVNDEIQFTLKCPKCKTFSYNKRFRKNKVNTNKSYYKCPSCKKNCYYNPNIMKHMVKGDTF